MTVLALLTCLVIATVYVIWCTFIIEEGTRAVRKNLGRRGPVLRPGLHFVWRPFQTVVIIDGTKSNINPSSQVVTDADGGEWQINMVVNAGPGGDPRNFIFQQREPMKKLVEQIQAALVSAIGGYHTDDLFTQDVRDKLQVSTQEVAERLAKQLGIEIDEIAFQGFNLVGATRSARDELIKAEADAQARIIRAEAEAEAERLAAEAELEVINILGFEAWSRQNRLQTLSQIGENGGTVIAMMGSQAVDPAQALIMQRFEDLSRSRTEPQKTRRTSRKARRGGSR